MPLIDWFAGYAGRPMRPESRSVSVQYCFASSNVTRNPSAVPPRKPMPVVIVARKSLRSKKYSTNTAGVSLIAVRRVLASDHLVLAVSSVAVLGLLASPVSWSHHWVWVVPLLMAFGHLAIGRAEQEPTRRALWAGWTLAGIALMVVAPHWRLTPGRSSGLDWPILDQVLASSYVWWGVATLVLLAVVRLPARTSMPAAERPVADPVTTP